MFRMTNNMSTPFIVLQTSPGRRYQTQPLHAAKPGGDTRYEWKGKLPPPGRYWAFSKENMERLEAEGRIVYSNTGTPRYKIYLDESLGKPLQDMWDDVAPVHVRPKERLGYPTQKPEALLERIIQASSNEGDVVLDPFCGCGTAVSVAERLKRCWIGIDITHLAISLMKNRLHDTFGTQLSEYEVVGVPQDTESGAGAGNGEPARRTLSVRVLGAGLGRRPPRQQPAHKGADAGVDGYINFFDDESGKAKTVLVQVKSGHVQRNIIATLKGDMEREKAELGLLVTLEPPTGPMEQEAMSAGVYVPERFPDRQYPRVQIATIEDLLTGHGPDLPRLGLADAPTFRRAARRRATSASQRML